MIMTRVRLAAVGIACLATLYTLFLVPAVSSGRRQSIQSTSVEPGGVGRPPRLDLVSLADPESGGFAKSQLLDLIDQTILTANDPNPEPDDSDSEDGQHRLLAVHDLSECAAAIFSSLLSGDPEHYLTMMKARGALPDAENGRGVANVWVEWKLIEPLDLDDLDGAAIFRKLWASNSRRSMNIKEIDPTWIEVGPGMAVRYEVDAWGFDGVRACWPMIIQPGGRPTQEEGDAANDTNASAHVTIFVRYGDDAVGKLRVNFIYDREESHWYPITLAVGSEAKDQWPFPFF